MPSGLRLPQRLRRNRLRFGGGRRSGDLGPRPGRETMRGDTKRHKPIRGKAAAQTEIPVKQRAGKDTSHRPRIRRFGIRVPPGVPQMPVRCTDIPSQYGVVGQACRLAEMWLSARRAMTQPLI